MTIRRQYSLPNCTLILEGLSTSRSPQVERPPLDILMRFECHLAGLSSPLTGGRELLENLAAAVSQFAQEFLSGISRSNRATLNSHSASVQLQKINSNVAHLVVQPGLLNSTGGTTTESGSSGSLPPLEVELSTVQAFDLVEAFDQFFADTQTLPDLTLSFKPLSKRESTAHQPATERAVPIAIGATSLTLAAGALFFIPIPEVEPPRPTPQKPNSTQPLPAQPSGGSEPSSKSSQKHSAKAILAANSPARDLQLLAKLNQKLYTQIDQAWKTEAKFNEDLVYQVGVDQAGKIIGYFAVNQAAADYVQELPLLELLDGLIPGQSAPKPLARFQVVFTPSGALRVSPWGGYRY